MKYLKILGLAALSAMALMAFASSASATTLEQEGVTTNEAKTITASLKANTSAILKDTEGFSANTCTTSHVHGVTQSPYTGTVVTGPLTGHTTHEKHTGALPSDGLSFANCTRPVTVHDPGTLEIEHIANTTNGKVASEEAQVTVGSPFGTLNCTTGVTTNIGTLTGVASGHATMDVNAVINCGFFIPTAKWEATYTVTSPTGLGVSA